MTIQSKKMLPMCILEILNKYTDENHTLTQKNIEMILRRDYNLSIERKTVKRAIMDLIDIGVSIQYTETFRMVKDKKTGETEDQSVLTDFYMERDFNDCEIRLLIDEILDSRFIPTSQRNELISKLENLSSVYFRKGSAYKNASNKKTITNQLFYSIDVIDEALSKRRKVRFNYQESVKVINGKVESVYVEYTVTPYDMRIVNGDYLLYCSEDGITTISLRVDYISDITITDDFAHAAKKNEFINMNTITFISDETMIDSFVDYFGKENIQVEIRGNDLVVTIHSEESKAIGFSLLNSNRVTIVAPEDCRRSVCSIIQSGQERYELYAM